MSVYDNNKVYPTLPSVSADNDTAQKCRLQKISEIEFFLYEIEQCENLAKKFQRISDSVLIADTGLIITTVITESTSIAAFASGVAMLIGIALMGASVLFSIATVWQEYGNYECQAEKT